jgi:hypothetical protein
MALVVAGCVRPAIPDSPTVALASPSPTSAAVPSSTPSPVPTATLAVSSPTSPAVIVSAVKGNVFIRRGPDLAFDSISVLMDRQSARALARDVLAKWVQIPIPGLGHKTGWISVQTHFVALTGDIMQLPELTPTDWPVLASLRNCTTHVMEADPGGIPVPAVSDFPDNEVTINPGIYTIHDTAVDGSPQVMEVEIREGQHIDIRTDGDGNHKKCPVP